MALTYNVYRNGEQVATEVAETTYTDTGLQPDTTYTYEVTAVNEWGKESPKSNAVEVKTDAIGVAEVTLDKNTLNLQVGATGQLNATVAPAEADQGVNWSSDNEEVATVDNTGLVTAVKEGSANITATSSEDNTKSASCAVTVSVPEPEAPQNLESTGKTEDSADLAWESGE